MVCGKRDSEIRTRHASKEPPCWTKSAKLALKLQFRFSPGQLLSFLNAEASQKTWLKGRSVRSLTSTCTKFVRRRTLRAFKASTSHSHQSINHLGLLATSLMIDFNGSTAGKSGFPGYQTRSLERDSSKMPWRFCKKCLHSVRLRRHNDVETHYSSGGCVPGARRSHVSMTRYLLSVSISLHEWDGTNEVSYWLHWEMVRHR